MAFVTDPNGGQSRTRTRFVLKGKENVGLADKLTGNGAQLGAVSVSHSDFSVLVSIVLPSVQPSTSFGTLNGYSFVMNFHICLQALSKCGRHCPVLVKTGRRHCLHFCGHLKCNSINIHCNEEHCELTLWKEMKRTFMPNIFFLVNPAVVESVK